METKRYSSYAQIKNELEILKVERELNLQKIILNVQLTKDHLVPKSLAKEFVGNYKSILYRSAGPVLKMAIPFIINRLFKRKRG